MICRTTPGTIDDVQHSDPCAYLRAAAAQVPAIPGEVAENAQTAANYVARADRAGADLVVFSELFLPAYHPPTLKADPVRCDIEVRDDGTVTDSRLDPICQAAQRYRIVVLIGASVRRAGQRFIATLLIDRLGFIRDVYHKQQLCDTHEHELFAPGDTGTTVVVNGWKLGLGICYDATFPEHARAAAVAGCHAYVSGGAFVEGGEHRCQLYHAARALDNTFYVVFSDAVAGPAPWAFGGSSAIYDPQGRVIDGVNGSGLAVADLEAAQLEQTRAAHTMLADRISDYDPRVSVKVSG